MILKLSAQKENLYNVMRRCGYRFDRENGEELVFSRVIGSSRSGYPRFHCYIKIEPEGSLRLNLHLDQKRPIYKGGHAHAGEYEGEVVAREVERMRQMLMASGE